MRIIWQTCKSWLDENEKNGIEDENKEERMKVFVFFYKFA
jgi:hypothetical protein